MSLPGGLPCIALEIWNCYTLFRSLFFALRLSFTGDNPHIQIVNSIRIPPIFYDAMREGRVISWHESEDVGGILVTNRWIMDTENWSACRVVAPRLTEQYCIVVGDALISVSHPDDYSPHSPGPLPPQELKIFRLPPFITLRGLEGSLQPFDLLPGVPLLPISTRSVDQFFGETAFGHLLPLGTSSFLLAGKKFSTWKYTWAPPTPAHVFDLDFTSNSTDSKGSIKSLLRSAGLSNNILRDLNQRSPNFYHQEYAKNFRRFAWWDEETHRLTLTTLQYVSRSGQRLTLKSQSRMESTRLESHQWGPPTVDCITGRSIHVRCLIEGYGRIKDHDKVIEVFDIVESRTSLSRPNWLLARFQRFFICIRWLFAHFFK
ncbi:hypothetical protein DL96DRAFT_1608239 [Flagelloscypha sp. PMI_526]|nr:hypothetical protein DL96DRAFT_1608239 [Flagelloscypha sp. PMI_526]